MELLKIFKKTKNQKGKEYETILVFINGVLAENSSCTCPYGSFYRFSKKNKEKKWICRHILTEYSKLVKISASKAREILIKQGVMSSEHLKKI